ncbi:MAG: L-seryl-tRNA(Sec) selenium transferase [Termitinemataceae bacterium]|nr:MAG: L-seryl-tRNA(Sec) selenium transferase [Termitinemataceae bacterium]
MQKELSVALLRSIPAMEDLLNTAWAKEFSASMGRNTVKQIITEAVTGIKSEILSANNNDNDKADYVATNDLIASRATALLHLKSASTLKYVVNASGVIIHTNLGRSPLADEALQAVYNIAGKYSTLEYDPKTGERGGRNAHVEWLLCQISGAEAALVVNNNAAAVLLALSATAVGREVIVSAGELVEIGDSFRIPEILSFSGAKMISVGCTNSTHIDDYRKAITENTAVLLKVHPSNYRIDGFVKYTSRKELAELAAECGLVFMEDLGSGLLCRLDLPFANHTPSVRDCLHEAVSKSGSNVVTFSGDKLLGGPQIGVIAGSKTIIDKIKRHQLLRALRVDKMTLAAFEATLRLYLAGKQTSIPVIGMIEAGKKMLLDTARRLCRMLKREVKDLPFFDVIEVVETEDAIGGGSFPTDVLHGYGVSLHCAATENQSLRAQALAAQLRSAVVPVIATIRNDCVILHVRTLLTGDEKLIAAGLKEVCTNIGDLRRL